MLAAAGGHTTTVQALLEMRVNVYIPNKVWKISRY
jgi:hypothetical protein